MDIKIKTYTGGMAQTNAYLLEYNDACILIDAPLGVAQWLKSIHAQPTDLLLTHQHYDHVEDAAALASMGAKIHAHSAYSQDLTLEKPFAKMGISLPEVPPFSVDSLLEGKETLTLGPWKFSLAHVPGHAPDSLAFITDGHAFSGDALFAGSIGRTDLPGGDMDTLVKSIYTHLFSLPDSTRVFPGHGPITTIEAERAENPFL